jgi:HEAT repeat protein
MDEITLILRDLKNSEWNVRQNAVHHIGEIRDPDLLRELIVRLRIEKWHIREAAAAGIRSYSDLDLADPLMDALSGDDDIIRDACARALGNMRCRKAEKLLEKAAADPDCRVRKTARIALEQIQERY